MKKKLPENKALVFLLIFQTLLLVGFCSHKYGMHMDEYFTFALANNETSTNIGFEDGKIYESSFLKN